MITSVTLALAVLWPTVGGASPTFALRDQDRIVFVGGSLTAEREGERYEVKYPTMAESFVRARYPKLHLRFFNRSVEGDGALDGAGRLDKDVLSLKPTVAVLCFGLSEVQRVVEAAKDEQANLEVTTLAEYADAMQRMTKRLTEAGCRVWLVSPPAADEQRHRELQAKKFNRHIADYAQVLRKLSEAEQVAFVDWHAISAQALADGRAADGGFFLSLDGVEPASIGHGVMAAALLRAWRADPYDFTVTVNWGDGTVDSPFAQTRVSRDAQAGRLRVELKGVPLFWPLSAGRAVEVNRSWPITDLTRLRVRVVNGPEIGLLMRQGRREVPALAKTLADGINLATLPGFRDVRAASYLLEQIIRKNRIRDQAWQDRQRTRPAELELQPAHDQFMEALDMYSVGYLKIIERLERSFDATVEFRDITVDLERPAEAASIRPKVGDAER